MATKEELLEKRKKELATIKAQNEMLEQAKKTAIKRGDVSEDIIKSIDDAKNQNLNYARNTFGASAEDVANARYHGASVEEVKKYQKRLEKKGLTASQVEQKELAVVGEKDDSSLFINNKRTEVGVGKIDDNGEIPSTDLVSTEQTTKKRRTRKKRETEVKEIPVVEKKETEEKTELTPIKVRVTPDETIKQETNESVDVKKEKENKKTEGNIRIEDFNLQDIPDYVQYDIIPLPSKGECYAHKKGRIPVAYLTASDENLIASPNMYRDGNLLNVILRRKILDKTINVDELCSGDRDAIILWLRATAYGDDFPIVATHPETGKQYNVIVPLSSFKYYDFNLKGNDKGLFEYRTENGDLIEFKFLSRADEEEIRRKLTQQAIDNNKLDALKNITDLRNNVLGINDITDEDLKLIDEDIEEMLEIIGTDVPNGENLNSSITDQMIAHTVAVNGKTDREYITNYIENMRSIDAISYRKYFTENKPGVDFTVHVNVPESDGGGSFDTFLRYDDTIFINF